jgi:hypothetical protein
MLTKWWGRRRRRGWWWWRWRRPCTAVAFSALGGCMKVGLHPNSQSTTWLLKAPAASQQRIAAQCRGGIAIQHSSLHEVRAALTAPPAGQTLQPCVDTFMCGLTLLQPPASVRSVLLVCDWKMQLQTLRTCRRWPLLCRSTADRPAVCRCTCRRGSPRSQPWRCLQPHDC